VEGREEQSWTWGLDLAQGSAISLGTAKCVIPATVVFSGSVRAALRIAGVINSCQHLHLNKFDYNCLHKGFFCFLGKPSYVADNAHKRSMSDVRACAREGMHACMHACVCMCVRALVCACVCARACACESVCMSVFCACVSMCV